MIEESAILLAESEHFAVYHMNEECLLEFKKQERSPICIGDFYGDPDFALIDSNEKFVLMGGCGIIIYMLGEPYEEYKYNCNTTQWLEIDRNNGRYFTCAQQVGPKTIRITDTDGIIFEYRIPDVN